MRKGCLSETSPLHKVFILLVVFVLAVLMAGIATHAIVHLYGVFAPGVLVADSPNGLKLIQTMSAITLFIIPSLIAAWLFCSKPLSFLSLDRGVAFPTMGVAVAALLFVVPFISWTEELNKAVVLPSSIGWLEEWFMDTEANAVAAVELLISGEGWSDVLTSFLVIALVAGVSEEILFRGFLQNGLVRAGFSTHAAIWLTAFLFSAIHLQFYGFLPRMLLGGLMGYLLVWSGSVWLPIVVHSTNNALFLLFQLLRKRGAIDFDFESFQWSDHPVWLAMSFLMASFLLALLARTTKQNRVGIAEELR